MSTVEAGGQGSQPHYAHVAESHCVGQKLDVQFSTIPVCGRTSSFTPLAGEYTLAKYFKCFVACHVMFLSHCLQMCTWSVSKIKLQLKLMPLGVEKTSCMFLDFFRCCLDEFPPNVKLCLVGDFSSSVPQTDLHNTQMLFMALEL